MAEPAIKAQQLSKTYSGKGSKEHVALSGIDIEIPRGSFFGLLGPNGAGKSTFINIMAGLVNKTSGSISICGHDLDSDTKAAKRSIGIVPQELVLDPFFPPFEALENTAGFYGVPKSKRRTMEIIEALGLKDKAFSQSRKLSGGMRRRLLIAKALVHSPEVLVLDEPTAGVDVELRNSLWEYVKELNKQGTTILLTTHYLEEAEELCDNIAVINHGKIIKNDSKKNIMKIVDRKKLILSANEEVKDIPKALQKYNCSINADGNIEVNYKSNETSVDEILQAFIKSSLTIRDLSTEEADLEEIFRHLTKD